MFIFTMLFSLITLPFALLRMAFGLLGISTSILLFPVKMVARHLVLSIIVVGVLILYFAIKKDPHSLDQLKPAPAQEKQVQAPQNGIPPVIQAVRKTEDGDSAFATDTYAIMSDVERAAYSKVFYSTMSRIVDGQSHSWSYYNIQGTLSPTKTFKNNNGTVCRKFTEVLKVHDIQQTLSGTACDNGGQTWCKLKPNATPSCGLGGHKPGLFDGLTGAVSDLF